MIKNWLRRRLGVAETESDDDLDDEDRERGLLVRKGQLVALRTHVGANREAFQRWYGDPEIAGLLRHDLEPLSDFQSRGYFDTFILPASARGVCFAIHERRGKRLIGTTALTDRTTTKAGTSALFRIAIGEKDTWGKGYGTEATRLALEEAFESLGLNEVRLEVFGHNTRAIATYERVGFEVVGEHVEWVPRRKIELRVIEMRIIRENFAATADEWGPSKRGSASRGGAKDREERVARRAQRTARAEGARRLNPRRSEKRPDTESSGLEARDAD